jgi:predicted MFS family arabinose efflux permease
VSAPGKLSREQSFLTAVIAGVQFINILEFVIVMPLGPYFRGIGVGESQMGFLGMAYTGAACLSGLIAAPILDRFDRKRALVLCLVGLVTGTASCGFAVSLPTLMAARFLAGAFGGPATALSLAIISDRIPAELRGRAMGRVLSAFSIASVGGIPLGLLLAEHSTWRVPFLTICVLGLVVAFGAWRALPSMTSHLLMEQQHHVTTGELLAKPQVRWSYLMTATVMLAGFIVIPNISNYLTLNFDIGVTDLKYLYLFGGVGNYIAANLAGQAVDRWGSMRVAVVGAAIVMAVTVQVFYLGSLWPQTFVLFSAFMIGMGIRNVAHSTLATKVPGPAERGRFQSLQSSVQHAATAMAGAAGPLLLSVTETPAGKRLTGMPTLAVVSLVLTAVIPLLMWRVEGYLKATAVDRLRGDAVSGSPTP